MKSVSGKFQCINGKICLQYGDGKGIIIIWHMIIMMQERFGLFSKTLGGGEEDMFLLCVFSYTPCAKL